MMGLAMIIAGAFIYIGKDLSALQTIDMDIH